MHDAIISLKPRHADNVLSGAKTVELRTRGINLPEGAKLWIYTTLPVGKVSLSAEIDFIECLPPDVMWEKHGKDICITKSEFDDYTNDREMVVAIGLRNVSALERDVCLSTMRSYEENFQPPQFFSRLYPERALYSAFYS